MYCIVSIGIRWQGLHDFGWWSFIYRPTERSAGGGKEEMREGKDPSRPSMSQSLPGGKTLINCYSTLNYYTRTKEWTNGRTKIPIPEEEASSFSPFLFDSFMSVFLSFLLLLLLHRS